jgi:hypothetical protein
MMIEKTFYGIEHCNPTQLQSDVVLLFPQTFVSLTYDKQGQSVLIVLNQDDLGADEERLLSNIVNDHLSALSQVREAKEALLKTEEDDVDARWFASPFNDKTPDGIYQLVQSRIAAWSNLTQAKADLREWLPLLLAHKGTEQKRKRL